MVVMTVGIAIALKLSVLLALLGMGALVRNADRDHHLVRGRFGQRGPALLRRLFVITGASLDLALLATAGAAGLAFVLVRFAGKAVGVLALAPVVGLAWRKGVLLATALVPMSGLAVVLVHQTAVLYPESARAWRRWCSPRS